MGGVTGCGPFGEARITVHSWRAYDRGWGVIVQAWGFLVGDRDIDSWGGRWWVRAYGFGIRGLRWGVRDRGVTFEWWVGRRKRTRGRSLVMMRRA